MLEYFLNTYVSNDNFNNPEFCQLLKPLIEIFDSKNLIYEDRNEAEENDKYWVI